MTTDLAELERVLREEGVRYHPGWCAVIVDEELGHCQHVGQWHELELSNGATLRIRPRVPWHDDDEGNCHIEVELAGDDADKHEASSSDARASLWLRWTHEEGDLDAIGDLWADARAEIQAWLDEDDPDSWKPAYPGADEEEA